MAGAIVLEMDGSGILAQINCVKSSLFSAGVLGTLLVYGWHGVDVVADITLIWFNIEIWNSISLSKDRRKTILRIGSLALDSSPYECLLEG